MARVVVEVDDASRLRRARVTDHRVCRVAGESSVIGIMSLAAAIHPLNTHTARRRASTSPHHYVASRGSTEGTETLLERSNGGVWRTHRYTAPVSK